MLIHHVTVAWRNLVRNKTQSLLNIAGLAAGLAVVLLIILYIRDEKSFDRFHTRNPNIYRIVNQWVSPQGAIEHQDGNTGALPGPKFSAAIPEIKSYVRVLADFMDINHQQEIKGYEVLRVDSSFFSVFTFPLLHGAAAGALSTPDALVISEKMAAKFFGKTDVVGQTMLLKRRDHFEPFRITAVSRTCPENSSIRFDFLIPFNHAEIDYQNSELWFSIYLNTFVLLQENADVVAVEQKMKKVYESDAAAAIRSMRERFDITGSARYLLQPLLSIHLSTDFAASNGLKSPSKPLYSYLLSGTALFILLIACINFINLSLAHSLKRAREIGVRKTVGGARHQLAVQFLHESFLQTLLAFVLALVLVLLALPAFNRLSGKALAFSYLFDLQTVLWYAGLFVLTGLVTGLYPAFILTSYKPVLALGNRLQPAGKNYVQKGLVVLQFTLASFLIIATVTIYRQFNYLVSKDLGYDDKNVIMVDRPGMTVQQAELFTGALLKNPDIVAAAPKNLGRWGTVARINGDTQISFDQETVDAGHLPLFRIPLVTGRNFSKEFPADSAQAVLVNEAFVKKAGWKNPVGQRVTFITDSNRVRTVIGVVRDHHFTSLTERIGPQVFIMRSGNGFGMFNIRVKPEAMASSLHYIGQTFRQFFPLNAFAYRFRDQVNAAGYESEQQWKQITLCAAGLAILISCFGLFALAAFSAERRKKEVGIRKVLGASVTRITLLLSTDFLKLVCWSFLFAFPAAWWVIGYWLENYPYRITPGFGIFGFTTALVLLIAFLTVSFQALKTAWINPARSLKAE